MHGLIEQNRAALEALCRTHGVRRLEIFGSAAKSPTDSPVGDLDFLVVFEESDPVTHADRYFGLLADLQDLFRCEIDLVELQAIRNPHFRQGIESTRTLLYAA